MLEQFDYDPLSVIAKINPLMLTDTTFLDYKKKINLLSKKDIKRIAELQLNLFAYLADQTHDLEKKMNFLFNNAHRFDPNMQVFLEGSVNSEWKNTALHDLLINEDFRCARLFLEEAERHKVEIDLTKRDIEGKTALLLAIRLAMTPLDIIAKLLTSENYNLADDDGITPLMWACAVRRVDIVKKIIQMEANRLGLGQLDFDNLTDDQRMKLSDFVNQRHGKSGKPLAHFAVLRMGSQVDITRNNPHTIATNSRSVVIDGIVALPWHQQHAL